MIPFDQKTHTYRPENRVMHIPEVEIVRTIDNYTVQDVIEKIQKLTKQKSLRINEFMRDYTPSEVTTSSSVFNFYPHYPCLKYIYQGKKPNYYATNMPIQKKETKLYGQSLPMT